jgi:DNA-binding MarR family transcriptional regulator
MEIDATPLAGSIRASTLFCMESLERAARDVEANCLCTKLRKASRAVTQRYDEALAPTGIRSTQFSVLVALAHAPEVPLSRLAQALVMDRTTLTRNLSPLIRDGLVEERPAADGRVRLFALTARGKKTFEAALPAWKVTQAQMTRSLAEDVAPMIRALSSAVAAARGA